MIALAVVLAVLAGFIVRLVDIQVVNADTHIADSMKVALGASRTLYGTRGEIVDESGQLLAGSILLYDGVLDPKNVGPVTRENDDGERVVVPWAKVAGEIGAVTGQTSEEIQKIVADALADDPDSQFAYLKRGLTTEQYRDLVAIGAPFLTFDAHPARTYPDGAVAGNLVGFMGSDAVPLAGIEKSQNDCLLATNGTLSFQKGKDGVTIPGTEQQQPAVNGGTLELTINRDLQWYLQQLIGEQTQDMGAKSGTISVVEVKTGKVRAMADYPTVDPNDFAASPDDDLYSRIFKNTFEPGSTFKPITAATLIDAAGQTPTSTVIASGWETFDNGARVTDSFSHEPYLYTLAGVLIDSSNAGISRFSERVDPQVRYDYLKKFGISTGSAIGFVGEQQGLVYEPSEWDNQTVYNTTFGQALTTTVPELLGAYGTIANDGVKVPLRLVESCTHADGTDVQPDVPDSIRVLSESTAVQVQQMLENVALQAGYADDVAVPGYRVAVKSGTGEQVDPETGRYRQGVYFTTMIGFAPADDPQYVVAVTFDSPTKVTSSAANAPAFQKAMTQVLKTYRVMPATTEPTLLPKFG